MQLFPYAHLQRRFKKIAVEGMAWRSNNNSLLRVDVITYPLSILVQCVL